MSESRRGRGVKRHRFIGLLALLVLGPAASHAPFARQTESWVLVGRYEMDGVRHRLATVWHTREDGSRLLATSLGTLDSRVIDGGLLEGRSVSFTLRERVGDTVRNLAFAGRWNGSRMAGTLSGPSGTGRLVLRTATTPIVERGLIFAETDASGNPVAGANVSVALDSGGALIVGRFGQEGGGACARFGCSGDVVSFRERTTSRRTRLTARLRSDDACPVVSEIDITFDTATLLYSGTFSATDCAGGRDGTLIAVRGVGTNSVHASQILGSLGRLADDLERETPLAIPHPSFSTHYLHGSRTLADLFAGYDDERRLYSLRRASFNSIHSIRTIPDPLMLPGLSLGPLGVDFVELREGVPRAGGPPERFVDTEKVPAPRRVSAWGEESGRWVVTGDQFSMNLPFSYMATDRALEIATPEGNVWVSPGAFGAHNGPHTGHVFGDGKANFIGFFSDGDSEMVDLGNGNGIREPGELWGYFGGVAGARVRNRTPVYVAPADATLREIIFRSAPTGVYFDNVPQWGITLEFSNGMRLLLDHVGTIVPTFRNRILSELGIDLSTYVGPPGVVVPPGSGLRVAAGEALARPQVLAQPIPGHPGYFAGINWGGAPWAQMEFKLFQESENEFGDTCVFEHIPRASHQAAQRVMDAQMADPDSTRYRLLQSERWSWAAEGRACMTYSEFPGDFSSLDTAFGGWFERDGSGIASDEVAAFVRIARDSASYDLALYDARNAGYLFRRQRAFGVPMDWLMPNGSLVRPFYPAGELLERTDSTLLIKWRDVGYRDASGADRPVYQWASYVLNSDGLKIAYGPFLDDPSTGGPPAVSATTPCNGTTVVCYDHLEKPGY